MDARLLLRTRATAMAMSQSHGPWPRPLQPAQAFGCHALTTVSYRLRVSGLLLPRASAPARAEKIEQCAASSVRGKLQFDLSSCDTPAPPPAKVKSANMRYTSRDLIGTQLHMNAQRYKET